MSDTSVSIPLVLIDSVSLSISLFGLALAVRTYKETPGQFYLWFLVLAIAWVFGYTCFVLADFLDPSDFIKQTGKPVFEITGETIFALFSSVYIALVLQRFRVFDNLLQYPKQLLPILMVFYISLAGVYIAAVILVPQDPEGVKGLRWGAHFAFYGYAGLLEIIVAIISLMIIGRVKTRLANMTLSRKKNDGPGIFELIARVGYAIAGQLACFLVAFIAVLFLEARLSYSIRGLASIVLLQFSRLYFKYIINVVQFDSTRTNQQSTSRHQSSKKESTSVNA